MQANDLKQPMITEVTEDRSVTEEMSLVVSEFQNTQLLNSALTMTQSKVHESRTNNPQYSSSMLVSDTSYYERQTQLQETKSIVNQLEAARQKHLEVYYSVSDLPPGGITGENSKNTTRNGSGSIHGKERASLNKVEKGEYEIRDQERMSLKEFK